tara:strand:+ start:724 stop:1443 length:720 start_codon:yes stop_codon:yes gene_type:complete
MAFAFRIVELYNSTGRLNLEWEGLRLRKDGESTRGRILDAALQLFGEKGFYHTTNAEVCESAQANIAAINYHFRTKEQLYKEVCQYAIASINELYPPEGIVEPAMSPEGRLRAHIASLIMRSRVTGSLRYYHNLRMMETFNPTGLVDEIWQDWFRQHTDVSMKIIRKLVGPGAQEVDVARCQLSLAGQCYLANSMYISGKYVKDGGNHLDDEQAVIDHIYIFTCAGIQAAIDKIKARTR